MKWISNDFEELFRGLQGHDYVELTTADYDETFFLIHGFGSSILDLAPLANELYKNGKRVILIALDGHRGKIETEKMNVADWISTCSKVIELYQTAGEKSYLLGFSIGAVLSLQLSTMYDFHGMICISNFTGLEPGSLQSLALRKFKDFGIKETRRYLQVSHKKTKKEIAYFNNLDVNVVADLNRDVSSLIEDLPPIRTKALFFHSYHDAVSGYESVTNLCNQHVDDYEIITLRNLKHFLQFDIPSKTLLDYVHAYFNESDLDVEEPGAEIVPMLHEESNREISQNVGNNFNLIIGFFSVFGALLYFTLPIVTANDPSSPYYITSYSLIINIYILIASTYVFYMNRAIAYTRNHVEPYYSMIGINEYKQNEYMAGSESTTTTKKFSAVTTVLPILASLGAMIYNFRNYADRFLVIERRNILLQLAMAACITTFLLVAFNLISLLKHANREIYGIHLNRSRSQKRDIILSKLYYSVVVGCNRQNRKFLDRIIRSLKTGK